MPKKTLPNFGKVAKKMATVSLLPNFGNYLRNPAKILASCQNFGNYAKFWQCQILVRFFFGIKVNRPVVPDMYFIVVVVVVVTCSLHNNKLIIDLVQSLILSDFPDVASNLVFLDVSFGPLDALS